MLLLGTASSLSAADWAERMFEVKRHDFGRVPFGGRAEFEFPVTNVNPFTVEISRTRVSCECTKPITSKMVLRSGQSGVLAVALQTSKYNGRKGATITVTLNKPAYAEVQLHVTSYIDKQIDVSPASLDLGSLQQGTEAGGEVAIRNAGNPDWRITEVRSSNPHLHGEVERLESTAGGVSYRLRVRLDRTAPGGYFKDQLVLVTNDAQSSQLPVLVQGQVRSEITVSPAALIMGVAAPGAALTKVIVIRGKRPFRLLSIDCDLPGFAFSGTAAQQPKSLYLVPVTFRAGSRAAKVSGTIRIRTDLGPAASELPVRAQVTP